MPSGNVEIKNKCYNLKIHPFVDKIKITLKMRQSRLFYLSFLVGRFVWLVFSRIVGFQCVQHK